MDQAKGTITAALILALAVLGGAYLVKSSLDRGVDDINASLAELQTALASASNAGRVAAAPRRRGPDPERRHTVNLAGAPTQGPAGAKVTLVEFSDFQ